MRNRQRRPRRTHHTDTRRLGLELLEDRRMLAVFTVSNVHDAGVGSLRQAILNANNQGGPDTIEFSSVLFNTAQTISLASALPTISEGLTLSGRGKDLLILDAGNGPDNLPGTGDGYRLLDINDGDSNNEIDVIVHGLTLTGGDVSGAGGAIQSRENLTLRESSLVANATGPGALGSTSHPGRDGGHGGGIFSSGGNLTILSSTVRNNFTGDGGAANGGPFGGEGGNGGGIYMDGDDLASTNKLVILNSTISGNSTGSGGLSGPSGDGGYGGDGGGIYTVASDVQITGSTISGNSTGEGSDGAAGKNGGFGGNGGGLYSIVEDEGSVEISSSTITGNQAKRGGVGGSGSPGGEEGSDGNGGGLYIDGGSEILLANSIVAANQARAGAPDFFMNGAATFDVQFNLIGNGDSLSISGGTGNQIGSTIAPINPRLGPLAANGGPTETHALLPGSSAIDSGDPSILFDANEFDQRGTAFRRVEDGNFVAGSIVDLGAYEAQAPSSADFDQDSDVDGADFLTWQRGYGTTSGALLANGNSDDDEDVDASDLAVWQASFSQGPASLQAQADNMSLPLALLADSNFPADLAFAAYSGSGEDSKTSRPKTLGSAPKLLSQESSFTADTELGSVAATQAYPENSTVPLQSSENNLPSDRDTPSIAARLHDAWIAILYGNL